MPSQSTGRANASDSPPKMVAVIDIGASSVRMQIAELLPDGTVRRVESFEQAVALGKDSFIKGYIEKSTIEDCVHVLEIYRSKLQEYGITDPRDIRVIGTSGVQEAANRLAFQDRIYIATGFDLDRFDQAELHRVTFVGIFPCISRHPEVFEKPTLVCEVGGGTTEFLMLEGEQVRFAQAYRLGALRLRKTLEAYDAPLMHARQLMEAQIGQILNRVTENAGIDTLTHMVGMGSDLRFASREITGKLNREQDLIEVPRKELRDLTHDILQQSTDRLAATYHLSLPEAESLGPALLCNCMIAEHFGVERLFVASVSLRDGLIQDMAGGGVSSDAIQNQVAQSVRKIGQKFHYDEPHANHVATLACSMFTQLETLHRLEPRFCEILQWGALLHEIGLYISSQSYHKHSLYLIRNSEFFGLRALDVELVGLVARYHRRATPQPNHDGYSSLDRDLRVSVSKLAALLRIAKALDASRSQRINQIECAVTGKQLVIKTDRPMELSLERLELSRSSSMFEDIFGLRVILRDAD